IRRRQILASGSIALSLRERTIQWDETLALTPRERTLRSFIAPCAPEPSGVRSARRPGAQRVRMQSATWGGFRHEQAVGAAATGDRSRSKGRFMGRGMPRVSSVSNEPPLPGPLLHLMEEREL